MICIKNHSVLIHLDILYPFVTPYRKHFLRNKNSVATCTFTRTGAHHIFRRINAV